MRHDLASVIIGLAGLGFSHRKIHRALTLEGHHIALNTVRAIMQRGAPNAAVTLYEGDCRTVLPTLQAASVQTVVTSPPYWKQRRGPGIGQENSPADYVAAVVAVLDEVHRVLRNDGTVWLNLGDTYNTRARMRVSSMQQITGRAKPDLPWREVAAAGGIRMPTTEWGLKEKDVIGLPWRVALALQARGWFLRSAVVWHKTNAVPENVLDRPRNVYEHVFLLSKRARYMYDHAAIARPPRAPGRTGGKRFSTPNEFMRAHSAALRTSTGKPVNEVNVWRIAPENSAGTEHFSRMPVELARRCIQASTKPGDVVLDPFAGVGTTAVAATALGRKAVLIELHPPYIRLTRQRLAGL